MLFKYAPPLHPTPHTPHEKNCTKMQFFLHNRIFFCTFAAYFVRLCVRVARE